MRGADRGPAARGAARGGASPRARGRRPEQRVDKTPQRSIPACAGPTVGAGRCGRSPAEHPRVRGADCERRLVMRWPSGASPRARGRRPIAGQPQWNGRSIPACAGPTCSVRSSCA
ncbi:hypothetical protein STTU_p0094 (plasmid) [Streptomyces sp. Tu6071]|nr:hypothetical protein STTU_p0094 [Streptomyces sp. Tu6071]